ncbi:AraC family transcriptional regulator [Paraflavitalea pollutisoli]|uniref:AraC family transcriptional regulator n=1 Tax=Paraflavitalea pollutisoli TaxID=3034143 RepID=UPI0023EB8F3E|nr:helix-turn-helix domain-containing protein [Paraflavitalea sp. H1-2-19X]
MRFHMNEKVTKKRDGFDGQKAIGIPRNVLQQTCSNHPFLSGLHITDIGYYPKAKFHYRKRAHGADEHILIYCVRGSGMATVNKVPCKISAGGFFVVPKSTDHTYQADENDPWTIYWVHFNGSNAPSLVNYLQQRLNGYTDVLHYSEKRIDLFDSIYHCLERGYSAKNMVYANMCFSHFLVSFMHPENIDHQNTRYEEDVVDKAITIMTESIRSVCNLSDIAARLNVSSSHLSFLFRQKTGYPPMEYMNHLKVQKACQYLLLTTKRIHEIAEEIGIEDAYYFSRFFKRQMGMSPRAYRDKKRLKVE